MGYNFFPCEREQLDLMPPALQDWLPEGDLAWFILDAVAEMNLSAIERTSQADGWGQSAYEPAMKVALDGTKIKASAAAFQPTHQILDEMSDPPVPVAPSYSGGMISSLRERQSSTALRTCIL